MGVDLDRLSSLPDSLLSVILSKVPIREAIQSSVLSKRWRFLYREMPNLELSPILLTPPHLWFSTPDPLFVETVENAITNLLQSHSSDLMAIRLINDAAPWKISRQTVSNWMKCVSRKNVEHLVLRDFSAMEGPPPEALFSCVRLTMLTLQNYILTRIPTQFAGFKRLLSCTLDTTVLTDDSLTAFISHTPLLQTLHLSYCIGLHRPVISALNVTDLSLRVTRMQVLTVECPKLKNFEIWGRVNDLRVNGVSFHELSPAIQALEMHLGNNLIALSLESSVPRGKYKCSGNRFLEIVGSLKSLKVLNIRFLPLPGWRRAAVPVLNLLGRLHNLERLSLQGQLTLEEELQRNPMPSYLSSPIANLQTVDIHINKCDDTEIDLLSCLLHRSPMLESFKFTFSKDHEGEQSKLFSEKWAYIKRAHGQGKLPEKICEYIFYF